MANEYFANSNDLTSVANSIRNKTGKSSSLVFPDEFVTAINGIQNYVSTFTKVGQLEVGYNRTTLNIQSFYGWQNITVDDIYFVPLNFVVTTTGTITGGTYNINKTYTNGVITAWRDSVPGAVGIAFNCDVYISVKVTTASTPIGGMVKVGDHLALTYGAGISVDVKNLIPQYAKLTVNDFYLDLQEIDMTVTTTGGGQVNVTRSYDASTGIFTFARASIPFSGSMNNYCDVYAFVPYGS